MNVNKLAPVAKAIVAIGGAVVATAACLVDGKLTPDEVVVILTAWGTALGVYHVPNKGTTQQ